MAEMLLALNCAAELRWRGIRISGTQIMSVSVVLASPSLSFCGAGR
jgi:hypothetical protein